MQELGAQFHGNVHAGHARRPAASADARARLEHEYRAAGAREFRRGGEPGGAGADDDYIEVVFIAWQARAVSSR
jgi:hypothetical protein